MMKGRELAGVHGKALPCSQLKSRNIIHRRARTILAMVRSRVMMGLMTVILKIKLMQMQLLTIAMKRIILCQWKKLRLMKNLSQK